MANRFSPTRLIEARIEADMTQIALSECSNLSRMTISKLEKGLIANPSAETITSLSWALKKPKEYLCTDPELELKETAQPLFRSFKSKSKNDIKKAQIKLRHSELMVQYLYSYIEPRYNTLDSLFYEDNIKTLNEWEIEALAMNAREALEYKGDGPLNNLTTILENHGIICISVDLPADIDSLSTSFQKPGEDKETSIILFNSELNYYRQRFSIAHELGHIILHRYAEEAETAEEEDKFEQQANRFASSFLMPKMSFSNSFPAQTMNWALLKKEFWGTSLAAIIRRMKDLEMIDETKYRNMSIEISRRHWKKKEPLDDKTLPEMPYYMESAYRFLITNNITTAQAIRDYCGFTNMEIAEYIKNEELLFKYRPDESFELTNKSRENY